MCDHVDDKYRYFPIEDMLEQISTFKNTYIVALFDCGRENLGTQKKDKQNKSQNLMMLFSAQPGKPRPMQNNYRLDKEVLE